MREAHRRLLTSHAQTYGGDVADELLAAIQDFVERGVATGAVVERAADREAAQTLLDYWTTVLYRARRDPPVPLLDPFDVELEPALPDAACPYVGLRNFDENDADNFFGRGELVQTFLTCLEKHRLLAVVGPSGSGKSSAVRAGLLPRLRRGALPGSEDWHYCPALVPGIDPLASLARAIPPDGADPSSAEWLALEVERLGADPSYLTEVAHAKTDRPVVLVIDQFEELYTFDRGEDGESIVQAFLDSLLGLLTSTRARHVVILTMRSDFLESVAAHEAWSELFLNGRVDVPAPSNSQLREAIEEPAAKVGLRFEEGLVADLLSGIVGQPAVLPLLQFTLLKLWERRKRNRIVWSEYRDLTTGPGGQRGPLWALAHVAEGVYVSLSPED